jgi:ParB-like chromosome segregation protein Spo0J
MAKKKSEPALMKSKTWVNRIVSYGEEDPDQLLANPLNWRVHPKAQQVSLSGVLDDIGFIAPVIVNRTTGHMIDGHLRVQLALRNHVPSIPVIYVELSKEEEAEALITLDPIANMAAADMRNLEALIGDLGQIDDRVRLLVGEIIHESNKKAVKENMSDLDEDDDGEGDGDDDGEDGEDD